MNDDQIEAWLKNMTERFIGYLNFSDDPMPTSAEELKARLLQWLPHQVG